MVSVVNQREVKSKRKFRGNPLYTILLVVIFLALGLLLKKFLLFLVLTAITIAITYFNYYTRIPIDLTPIFFLSVIISFSYGLLFSVLFVLIVSLPPKLFSGSDFGVKSIFYIIINIIVNFVLVSISPGNIILFGIVGSVVYHLMSATLAGLMEGEIVKELLVSVINIGVSLFYFMNFGLILLRFLG